LAEARDVFQKAIRINPQNESAQQALAEIEDAAP